MHETVTEGVMSSGHYYTKVIKFMTKMEHMDGLFCTLFLHISCKEIIAKVVY